MPKFLPEVAARWGRFTACVFFAAAMSAACAPTASRKVLSFFIDGIPDIDSSAQGEFGSVRSSTAAAETPVERVEPFLLPLKKKQVYHPPFRDQLCSFCHNPGGTEDRLRYPLPNLCFECHGRVDKMGETVHWPVRQGRCTTCHNPHQAANERLKQYPIPRLCARCHNTAGLSEKSHFPEGSLLIRCLDCHNPHSTKRAKLLIRKK